MNRLLHASITALALLAPASIAYAQIETVPMKGLGNEWVKKIELRESGRCGSQQRKRGN